jgi:hypothetical protein
VRVYKLKGFARFQRGARIADEALVEAVRNADSGLVDADLGGGLIKQRVARKGQGKSGGYRTLIAFRRGDRAIFLYGFAKSDRENIDDGELKVWRRIGQLYLGLDAEGIKAAIVSKELVEVEHGATEQK